MIQGMYIAFILVLLNGYMPHDVPLAIFTLTQNDDKIQLVLKMENKDLEEVLQSPDAELSTAIIEQLISTTTTFRFDGKQAIIRVDNIIYTGDHLMVTANLGSQDFCQQITIASTLFNSIPNHSNIIQLRIGEKERDFRLHKDRTLIEIDL
jgi:hypothetical protein